MRILPFLSLLFLSLSTSNLTAQEGTVSIEQDDMINELVDMKKRMKNDRYRIQIFSGEIDGAQRTKIKYRTKFNKRWAEDVKYEAPNYKVWVGFFKSQLAAEKALVEIKELFPQAFVFKPQPRNKRKK